MDNEAPKIEQALVSAAEGSCPWVICRSTRNKQLYYFNTETGEAVWNLGASEREKARALKNNMNCPEPQNPPEDEKRPTASSSRIYNKQIINNRFPKDAYPMSPYMISPYNQLPLAAVNAPSPGFNPAMWTIPPGQFMPPVYIAPAPPMETMYRDQEHSVPVQSTTTSLSGRFGNREIITSEDNHYQKRSSGHNWKGDEDKIIHKNISHGDLRIRLSARRMQRKDLLHEENYMRNSVRQRRNSFHFEDEIHHSGSRMPRRNSVHFEDETHHRESRMPRRNSVHSEDETHHRESRMPRRNSFHSEDESCKYTIRRRNSVQSENQLDRDDGHDGAQYSKGCKSVAHDSENEVDNSSFNEENQKEKLESNNADGDWLEENVFVDGIKLKLNVTNLKKLSKHGMQKDKWYIVADMDILLHRLNFLNILFNSDDDCCLMVPQQVMAGLRQLSEKPRVGNRAKRAVAFLSQQLDAEYVVIGDGACCENDTRCDYLLNCCENLLEKNFHVVLLSNDEDFKDYKDSTDVPIFTMNELKEFLRKPVSEAKRYSVKPPPTSKLPIKITVTNDYLNKKTGYNSVNIDRDTISINNKNLQWKDETVTENLLDDVVHARENYSSSTAKYTIETGVQTDSESVQTDTEPVHTDAEPVPIDAEPVQTDAEPVSNAEPVQSDGELIEADKEPADMRFVFPRVIRCKDKTTPDQVEQVTEYRVPNQPGKKEIKLNRCFSDKTNSTTLTVENKQYKWRRRRIVSSTTMKNSKTPLANSSSIDDNSRDSSSAHRSDKVTSTTQQPRTKVDESASETSSSIVECKTRPEIIVEETSTSIISNSTSHQDSETGNGNKSSEFDIQQKFSKLLKNTMFEVSDQTMEDSIRIMADEWVSRFLQIMEEVLTQVLRKDKDFLNGVVYKRYGGGPWTILEALDCIKIKFINSFHVVDASKKLAHVLSQLSDNTGRIPTNLLPTEYMEMYNYGVYTIQSLRTILIHCEDLQTAEQSLAKLLSDIKNPHLDSSHNDTFGDFHPEKTAVSGPRQREEPQKESPSKIQTNNHVYEHLPPKIQLNRKIEGETSPKSQIYKATGEVNVSPKNQIYKATGEVNVSPKNQIYKATGEVNVSPKNQIYKATGEVNVSPKNQIYKATGEVNVSPKNQIYKATGEVNLSPKSPVNRTTGEAISPISQISATVGKKVTPAGSFEKNPDLSIPSIKQISITFSTNTPTRQMSTTSTTSTPKRHVNRQIEPTLDKTTPASQSDRNTTPSSAEKRMYNLRSKSKCVSPKSSAAIQQKGKKAKNTKEKEEVTVVRKIDESFFSSLDLVKKSCEPSQQETTTSFTSQSSRPKERELRAEINTPVSKVIRKFIVLPEHEKNIVSEVREREQLDMDVLDYSAPNDEDENYKNDKYAEKIHVNYDHETHNAESNYAHKSQLTGSTYVHSTQHTVSNYGKKTEQSECSNDQEKTKIQSSTKHKQFYSDEGQVPEEIAIDKNMYFKDDVRKFSASSPLSINNFHFVFETVLTESRNNLQNIWTFCEETLEDLVESRPRSIIQKYELNQKVEEIQNFLGEVINKLNIIFKKETCEPEKNIQSVTKNAGINDLDDNLRKKYGDQIGKLLEHAKVLEENLKYLVVAIKIKPVD